ncbi:LptF/LptG family permease, partial [Mesorhizobium sp. M7A.F.Ca.CA.002.09.1.1]
MGWTLGRYFFFRYVTITIWFFIGLLALVFLIDFTELSGRTTGLPGFTYGTAVAISGLRMPMIMLQTVPFVGLFSAMATLVSLNRRYELVIARSAGVSAWQFLLPCCIGALLFGVLSVGVINPLAAHAFSWSEQIETQLRSGKSNTVSADAAPWIRQKTSSGDTIIGARAILNQGLEMADVVFFILDPQGNIVERKDAARAFLRDGYWELQDVKTFQNGTIQA